MAEAGETPLVSVVSPFFNRAAHLPALIASLESQSFRDFELVIADDGSTDGLERMIARTPARFPVRSVRLFPNRGAATARNAGIDAARGHYVALLDSDDSFAPEKLEAQLRHLQSSSDDSLLVSLTRHLVKGRREYVAPQRLMTPADRVGEYLFRQGGIIQSSMMMLRRDLAAAVRFEDGSRGHDDWSFALRLEAAGARFEMLPEPLTVYDDGTGRQRRSPAWTAARLDWLAARRAALGDAAYWAAVAAVASRLQDAPRRSALKLIATARRNGAIGPARAGYYALATLLPEVRSAVRGGAQWWAARKGPAR